MSRVKACNGLTLLTSNFYRKKYFSSIPMSYECVIAMKILSKKLEYFTIIHEYVHSTAKHTYLVEKILERTLYYGKKIHAP